MRNLPPGTTLVLELPGMRDDPRNECGRKSPFHDGVGYGLSNRNGSNGGRKGFSLVDFLKDVAAGAVIGGLSGAAYYGGGKAVEVVRKGILRVNKKDALTLNLGEPNDVAIIDAMKIAEPTSDKVFNVFGHGNSKSIIYKNKQRDAREIAFLIKNSPQYIGEKQAVKLYACDTGKEVNGFAQQLANILRVDVIAPQGLLAPNKQGKFVVFTEDYHRLDWKTFNPQ